MEKINKYYKRSTSIKLKWMNQIKILLKDNWVWNRIILKGSKYLNYSNLRLNIKSNN
jgi:hypothetical protein